jgi:hypothetical protein
MTPEAEAKALSDAHEAWKQTNIQVVLHEMKRYGLTVQDLLANDIDPGTITAMGNKSEPQYDQSTKVGVTGT